MSSIPDAPTPSSDPPPVTTEGARPAKDRAGRAFAGLSTGAGALILLVLAAVAGFLLLEAWPAIQAPAEDLAAISWIPDEGSLARYVGPLVFGTLLGAVLALLLAVPVALGIALFISHYAPRRLASALGYVVDLLAAIPSVIYGLWGGLWLAPRVQHVWDWLGERLGFIPLFEGPAATPPRVMMTVGVVLAVMILPIITAVSREVFLQTPRLHEEAALALGATRWEMVRMAVLPFGRSGVISASMLGLGRALGETMAVLMILSPGLTYSFALLAAGRHQTIAANIALQFPEASPLGVSALIATGLALFVITLLVNMAARWVVARRADFSGAN